MGISIEAINPDRLADYANVPVICSVQSILAIDEIDGGMGGLDFHERPVQFPYTKNYDAYSHGGPLQWHEQFDISKWGLLVAVEAGKVIGGATVALNTPTAGMSDGRSDLAVLWDIRVLASSQRHGVGATLFRNAAAWAKSRGSGMLEVETQNVNVGACRFYKKMGCRLSRIDRYAYAAHRQIADEVMLIWCLKLWNIQTGHS